MATLLKDDAGVPIPQYMNESGTGFESMQGAGGAINAQVAGLLDSLASIVAAVDKTTAAVIELKGSLEKLDSLVASNAEIKTALDSLVADNAEIKTSLATIAVNTTPTTE